MIKLSVAIVLHQPDLELLQSVIVSYEKAAAVFYEKHHSKVVLFIVDNSECDVEIDNNFSRITSSSFQYLDLHYVIAIKNGGYGTGNNIVLPALKSDYHIISNPDVLLDDKALVLAAEYMQSNQNVGVLSPAIFSVAGVQYYCCKKDPCMKSQFLRGFAPKPIKKRFSGYLARYEGLHYDYSQVIQGVSNFSGCFLFYRTDVLQQLKGFDERFFMYNEDADLVRRTLLVAQTAYVPSVKLVHKWSRGSHGKYRKIAILSALQYSWKWFLRRSVKGLGSV